MIKKLSLVFLLNIALSSALAQALLPNYNSTFYPNVLQAAEGVAMPFLLQEQYKTLPAVTVKDDSLLVYNDITYAIRNRYLNPNAQYNNGYYISLADYDNFGIPESEALVWPYRMPYALYNSATTTFNSTIDCVGYGTRVLSATGTANPAGNAYMQLMNTMHNNNDSPFAFRGYVASAYQIAVAFATLPTNVKHGWQYIAGNVEGNMVDSIDQKSTSHKGLKKYTGISKGGFAKALPGDVLSFAYAPGGGYNGHFMVLEQAPVLLSATTVMSYYSAYLQVLVQQLNTLLQTYNVYAVSLYDSSGKNAHFNDSRKYMSGIGHGTILVLTDKATDTPQGYIFSPPKTAKAGLGTQFVGPHVLAVTVGRYIP
jgi:hypothetical protein